MTDQRTPVNPRRSQTIRAAWLYHERGLNQQDVADRLGTSRSTVSRLLADAERSGIVRVVVTEPPPESTALADRLIERYGLDGAWVEVTLDHETPLDAAATALARRLEQLVLAGPTTIAAGWGRTLGMAAKRARTTPSTGVTIVDAFGHTTTPDIAASVEVSNTLAAKFGAEVVHIPSPGFAPGRQVADDFYATESVASSLDRARHANTVVVSVGITGPTSLLCSAGYLSETAMTDLVSAGAVGDIFGHYFTASGDVVGPAPLYPVSLSLDDLRSCAQVIAAAGGVEKADAVRGAIATGAINEIAVDDTLAYALLNPVR